MHILDAVQTGFGDGEETSLVIEMPLEQALLQLYVRVAIDILRQVSVPLTPCSGTSTLTSDRAGVCVAARHKAARMAVA